MRRWTAEKGGLPSLDGAPQHRGHVRALGYSQHLTLPSLGINACSSSPSTLPAADRSGAYSSVVARASSGRAGGGGTVVDVGEGACSDGSCFR